MHDTRSHPGASQGLPKSSETVLPEFTVAVPTLPRGTFQHVTLHATWAVVRDRSGASFTRECSRVRWGVRGTPSASATCSPRRWGLASQVPAPSPAGPPWGDLLFLVCRRKGPTGRGSAASPVRPMVPGTSRTRTHGACCLGLPLALPATLPCPLCRMRIAVPVTETGFRLFLSVGSWGSARGSAAFCAGVCAPGLGLRPRCVCCR